MRPLIHDDFLLQNETAKTLYHLYTKQLPIIDFHCHLDPKEIYEDRSFKSLFEVWLSGDHYKWRLMRANGVDEQYITGNKPDFEKFMKWAETVPLLIGNPLYHWTHMELKAFFGIQTLLSPTTAKEIYDEVNRQLPTLSARKMIEKMNVELICTTDDPIDSLKWHELIQQDPSIKTKVLPAFRPDKAIHIDSSLFLPWIKKLSKVVGFAISSLEELKLALKQRIEYFHVRGCRLSDHALDLMSYASSNVEEVQATFEKVLLGESITSSEIIRYKGHILTFLGQTYHELGWVQQYHIGALRNISSRMYEHLGPDTGFDAINDGLIAKPLSALLDSLDKTDQLPKTIVYTLNPRDFEVAITLIQGFQGGKEIGKLQFGAPWWFLDNIDGMEKQIKALANNGLLARFIGMLTDSRSFLSYPRHDYFRRVLCNYLGEQVEKGLYPHDELLLKKFAQDISYFNAKTYFGY
jgi:glucuronate isomerase